jgi:hypothetical protein
VITGVGDEEGAMQLGTMCAYFEDLFYQYYFEHMKPKAVDAIAVESQKWEFQRTSEIGLLEEVQHLILLRLTESVRWIDW